MSTNEVIQTPMDLPEISTSKPKKSLALDNSQWRILPNNCFAPVGRTTPNITPGSYFAYFDDNYGPTLKKINIVMDDIVKLSDSTSDYVLRTIQTFWSKKKKFEDMGQVFKRGVLLYGPPGSGKTVTIGMLSKDVINQGGIVVFVSSPHTASQCLAIVREVQPDIPVVCVYEDVDEIIQQYGEHDVLALLDGEKQISNVVNVLTTNYPSKLAARIINRPSRVDEVIKIDYPNAKIRREYLSYLGVGKLNITTWVQKTKNLTLAHLRELVVAVHCLGRSFEETVDRLQKMSKKIKDEEELNGGVGF